MATRIKRSLTRVKEIRRALPSSELNDRIARLAVLYEDLRLEFTAASSRSMKQLDVIGDTYRRLYFLRKAISTTLEATGAVQRIDQCPEFSDVRQRFTKPQRSSWHATVQFLRDHSEQLKIVRDDVGGHFLERAASYALSNMDARTVGVISIIEGSKHDSAGALLKFAGEIVVIAMTRHKGNKKEQEFFGETLDMVSLALEHIAKQVHILTYHYLWPRFRG